MSPLGRLRTWEEMLAWGTSDLNLWMDPDGKILNTPENLWPNAAMVEIGEDGLPEGWDLDLDIAEIIGWHYLLSRPSAKNRLESLARQNAATIPATEGSITHSGPWIPGHQPEATSRVVPPTPEMERAPNDSRGFAGGTYAIAYGWSGAFGPAGVGAYVAITMEAGQYPVVPRPDSIPAGATTFDVAMTQVVAAGQSPNTDTGRYQRKIPVASLTQDTIPIYGPWRNRGKPPETNRSAIPRAKRPRPKDYGTMPSDFSTLAGRWTPAIQYWLPTLPGSSSDGGARVNAVGLEGKPITIKADRYRVKVEGPAPGGGDDASTRGVNGASSASEGARRVTEPTGGGAQPPATPETLEGDVGRPDPREIRPSGKHPDAEYLGEELDHYESEMVGHLNAHRDLRGLPPLVLVASLNRSAEEQTSADAEGYSGTSSVYHVGGSDPHGDPLEVAAYLATRSPALEERVDAIGVARRRDASGTWLWRVLLGDDAELPDPQDLAATCERLLVGTEEVAGTVYQVEIPVSDEEPPEGVESADVRLSWDLVQGNQLGYHYSGSYPGAVGDAANGINGLGPVSCHSGGSQVAISDGALPSGILGRTSSDGRMIFNSALMRQCSQNARDACANHEMWHALGFDHTSNPSVLHTPIMISSSSNYASPTSYDKSEYHSKFGSGGGSGGGGGGAQGGGHPDGWVNRNEIHNPQKDIQGDFSQMPGWIQDMMPGHFGGGEQDPKKDRGGPGGTGGDEDTPEEEKPVYHYEWKESTYKEKTALYFRLPRMVRQDQKDRLSGLKATYWWKHDDLKGNETWYRAYDSRRGPLSYFDDTDAFDGRIECPGLPTEEAFAMAVETEDDRVAYADAGADPGSGRVDKRGRGPRVRLIAEDKDAVVDTSALEPPDKTSVPEPPEVAGIEVLPAGAYSAAVVGVLKGGGVTKRSRAARYYKPVTPATTPPSWTTEATMDISAAQTVKVIPSNTVNLIRNAEGTMTGRNEIEDWSFENTAVGLPGNVRVDEGQWRILTSTATDRPPRALSRLSPITDETITAACTINLRSITPGSLRVVLRQFDETRTQVGGALVIYDLGAVGEVSRVEKWTKDQRDPACRFVQAVIEARLVPTTPVGLPGAGTTNIDGVVKDLRVFPFDADIGKFSEGSEGDAASFAPPPDTPAPAGSYIQVGPAPQPGGGAGEPVAALRLATFEGSPANMGGFTPMGTGTRQISTQTPIFESASYRVADLDMGVMQPAFLEQAVTEVNGTRCALRTIYRIDLRPTLDPVRFHTMGSSGRHTAQLVMYPNGQLSLYVDPQGTPAVTIPLGMGVAAGGKLDVEVHVVPGKNGIITVSAATGNNTRETVFQENFDLTGRTGHVMRPGIYNTMTPRNRANFVMDQVAVTRDGDVLDREKPIPPPGVPTTEENRPLKANGSPRRYDATGGRINQLRFFLNLGEGVKTLPLLEDPVNVRPGVSYCVAAFSRWDILYENGFGALQVWLESDDPDLPRRRIVELSQMLGHRDWNPIGRPREDDYGTFTVPQAPENSPGYTRAYPVLRAHPGFYILQEFLFAQEAATFTKADMEIFAKRDARRTYNRAAIGYGDWTLPVVPEHVGNGTPGPMPGWWMSEVGVKSVEPAPLDTGEVVGDLTADFLTSPDGVDWAPYVEPGSQAFRLMRFKVAISSQGDRGYEIPAGGLYARSWTPVATLTRQDGSPFPGGAYVSGDLWVARYPQMDPRRVGDRLAPVPLSEVVDRLGSGFSVALVTEDAVEEVDYLSRVGRLRLEIPHMGNRVAGMALIVKCEEGISFEAASAPLMAVREFQGVNRRMISVVGSTGYAEVLQTGRLARPMGPGIILHPVTMAGDVVEP